MQSQNMLAILGKERFDKLCESIEHSLLSNDYSEIDKKASILDTVFYAIETAYVKGRQDESYRLYGPTISLYEE